MHPGPAAHNSTTMKDETAAYCVDQQKPRELRPPTRMPNHWVGMLTYGSLVLEIDILRLVCERTDGLVFPIPGQSHYPT